MSKEQFLDECRFAKVVNTLSGPALLIGGEVISVHSTSDDHVGWLSEALRRIGEKSSGETGSTLIARGSGRLGE